jgi:hypothetical protein
MAKLRFLSVALIAAAMLATPAMARESNVTSRHLAEDGNASTTPGPRHIGGVDGFRGNHLGGGLDFIPDDGYGGYGNRASGLRGGFREYGGRDVWGHWGTYYGPMVPTI